MIGAMPAVAVRHERRRQEKRTKRPSQLYLGGQWLSSQGSPPTPSPHGHGALEALPELYICGKVMEQILDPREKAPHPRKRGPFLIWHVTTRKQTLHKHLRKTYKWLRERPEAIN